LNKIVGIMLYFICEFDSCIEIIIAVYSFSPFLTPFLQFDWAKSIGIEDTSENDQVNDPVFFYTFICTKVFSGKKNLHAPIMFGGTSGNTEF
jgi:hypothetical protein